MPLDKGLYIHSGRDGALNGDTSESDVRALVGALKDYPRVAIHVHGGLVSKDRALRNAAVLAPAYAAQGIRPVFIAWESAFLDTIKNNLHEIDKEALFRALMKRLLKYAVGKLTQTDRDVARAGAGLGLPLPTEIKVGEELKKRATDSEPFGNTRSAPSTDLSEREREAFETALTADADFQQAVADILAARTPPSRTQDTAKGVASQIRGSSKTLLSADVLEELDEEARKRVGAKGLLSTAALIKRAGAVLVRVVKRMRSSRDHGLYGTVVEEVMRELYFDNIGAFIWGAMKKETSDTFFSDGTGVPRAGWTLAKELGALAQSGHHPELTYVGHSAGAIYGCHLLQHLAHARRTQPYPIAQTFKVKNLVFLAPACSFELFDQVLDEHDREPLFEHFRMYALSDERESGYWEVPAVYPRSLLYFVSGVTETEVDGKGAFDLPLLGMQRYHAGKAVYAGRAIERVRAFLSNPSEKLQVWSLDHRTDGLGSDADTHSGFDDLEWPDKRPATTMQSVFHLVTKGW